MAKSQKLLRGTSARGKEGKRQLLVIDVANEALLLQLYMCGENVATKTKSGNVDPSVLSCVLSLATFTLRIVRFRFRHNRLRCRRILTQAFHRSLSKRTTTFTIWRRTKGYEPFMTLTLVRLPKILASSGRFIFPTCQGRTVQWR